MGVAIAVIGVIAFLIVIVLGSAIPVLRDYERGVIFRLGRPIAQKGPGLTPKVELDSLPAERAGAPRADLGSQAR